MIHYMKKRDGRVVKFERKKITNAIMTAARKVGGDNTDVAVYLTIEVVSRLEDSGIEIPTADNIQDAIEKTLIENGHAKTAKEFILYRENRSRAREMDSKLMRTYEELTFYDSSEAELKRENANIDGDTAMGTMLRYGSEGAKKFNLLYLIPEDISKAHRNGDIHIHDLDFYSLTETCCQIDLEKLFKNGFSTGYGFLREPGEIRSYAALACIAIQSDQNDQHGGQSIPCFDYNMEPGVAKTFIKQIIKVLDILYSGIDSCDVKKALTDYRVEHRLLWTKKGLRFVDKTIKDEFHTPNKSGHLTKNQRDYVIDKAKQLTEAETHQAMEAVIHNLCTMHSRAGAQVKLA